jgi:hypothetical protein
MVGLLGMVLLSIVSRQLQWHVPGTDAYAGYLMAAAGFLALAHTLKRGEHIRVTLLLSALQGRARRALELWALAAAGALAALFAYYSVRLVWQPAVQRHLHRQRRHAAVDSAAGDGRGQLRAGGRLHRRAGARAARPARAPRARRGHAQ